MEIKKVIKRLIREEVSKIELQLNQLPKSMEYLKNLDIDRIVFMPALKQSAYTIYLKSDMLDYDTLTELLDIRTFNYVSMENGKMILCFAFDKTQPYKEMNKLNKPNNQ